MPKRSKIPALRNGFRAGVAVACALALAGCAELLPKDRAEVLGSWDQFDIARAAIDRIEPYRTRAADLSELGITPYKTPNVTLLTYSDVVLRFPLGATIFSDRLDRGVKECLSAGSACSGYAVKVEHIRRERVGNFWLDSLAFRRETEITGWNFNALILMVDDVVVYKAYGGQPVVHEYQNARQPLGPLQSWGDTIPSLIHY